MDISYRGTHFNGWQIQPNGVTVQEELEKALSTILRSELAVVGSGRTDTGVHAHQQIAHFESSASFKCADLAYKLNSLLHKDIAVHRIWPVKPEAHARFSAVSRTYHYHLHRSKNPFLTGRSYCFKPDLNIDLINRACKKLENWQNFECFSKVHTEVNHFHCTIMQATWGLQADRMLFIISADRFLRGMVRAVVGTLLDVGQERTSLEAFEAILASNDRSKAGRAAPADGLYLQQVKYPEELYLEE